MAALSQDYLNHYRKIPLQSLWFLVPILPFVNIGKEAMFVPLNFVLPPSDVESSVMTLMQTVFTRAAAQMDDILYETTHHKLLQEEMGGAAYYCQACRSVRAAHILQIMEGTRLLKACHGMGTKGQRDDVGSLVVTAKNPQILSAFLKALLDICPTGVIECLVQTNGFDPHLRLSALSQNLTSWEQVDSGMWQAHICP